MKKDSGKTPIRVSKLFLILVSTVTYCITVYFYIFSWAGLQELSIDKCFADNSNPSQPHSGKALAPSLVNLRAHVSPLLFIIHLSGQRLHISGAETNFFLRPTYLFLEIYNNKLFFIIIYYRKLYVVTKGVLYQYIILR